jgi:hypothetical protein
VQDLNIFGQNSPVGKMEVSTSSGLPQFKANPTIAWNASTKIITFTPTALNADSATMYSLIVTDSKGKKRRLNVDLGTPVAVTADLGAAAFDLIGNLKFTFLAENTGVNSLNQITRTFPANANYSQSFSNL